MLRFCKIKSRSRLSTGRIEPRFRRQIVNKQWRPGASAPRRSALTSRGVEKSPPRRLSVPVDTCSADDARHHGWMLAASFVGGHGCTLATTCRVTTNRKVPTVAERLACSPPTPLRIGFDPRTRHPRIFARGDRDGRCRWSGFLGDLPFPPLFYCAAAPYSSRSLSLLRAAEISSLHLPKTRTQTLPLSLLPSKCLVCFVVLQRTTEGDFGTTGRNARNLPQHAVANQSTRPGRRVSRISQSTRMGTPVHHRNQHDISSLYNSYSVRLRACVRVLNKTLSAMPEVSNILVCLKSVAWELVEATRVVGMLQTPGAALDKITVQLPQNDAESGWPVVPNTVRNRLTLTGTAVEKWLERSPTIKATRVRFPTGLLQGFSTWESCQMMRLVGFFFGDLVFPLSLHSGAAPYSLQPPSSALKTTMLRAAQISSLHFTIYRNLSKLAETVQLAHEERPGNCASSFKNKLNVRTESRATCLLPNESVAFPGLRSSTQLSENGAAPEDKRAGETGDPRQNPPANGIVWHDSHMRKSAIENTLYCNGVDVCYTNVDEHALWRNCTADGTWLCTRLHISRITVLLLGSEHNSRPCVYVRNLTPRHRDRPGTADVSKRCQRMRHTTRRGVVVPLIWDYPFSDWPPEALGTDVFV
ncbi:hypothetical protein PR048_019197 [Dryococelus australis]|uniref:Uncharacterized protein n=1 Tax=Dryococelus australis TaxID=614101 RepID=A0ABQ9H351_9NEOP|nr:hypothetical protein PR048_019197 [Dryococelus australis]